jgi:hypothetical protein
MSEVDEGVIVASDDIVTAGKQTVTIEQRYIPPLDGTVDEVHGYDMTMARAIAEVLVKYYPGYDWFVMGESRQGIVAFSIPDLMGPTLKQVIRLAQFSDLTPKLIRDIGGSLLERMGLRRGPMDRAEYEAAKRRRITFDFGDVKQ